jgi:hypothetical protein
MNRNDVIDVLSVVAAATRRTIGETDVDVWQAIIGDLPKDLSLRAVRDHLRDKPGVWLEPGHVHERVRAIRLDQQQREPDEAREARQQALESKVADRVTELAADKAIPSDAPKYQRRGIHPALTVRCPFCHASQGQPCVIPQTDIRRATPHPSRREAAQVAS